MRRGCFKVNLPGDREVASNSVMCRVEASVRNYHIPIKSTLAITVLKDDYRKWFHILLLEDLRRCVSLYTLYTVVNLSLQEALFLGGFFFFF